MRIDNYTVMLLLILFACTVYVIRGVRNSLVMASEKSRTNIATQTWQQTLPPVGTAFQLRTNDQVAWTTFSNTVALDSDASKAGNFKLIPCTTGTAEGWFVLESIDTQKLVACATPRRAQASDAPLDKVSSFELKCMAETSKTMQCPDSSTQSWNISMRKLVKPVVRNGNKLIFQGPEIGQKSYFWSKYIDDYGVETSVIGLNKDESKALEFSWRNSL